MPEKLLFVSLISSPNHITNFPGKRLDFSVRIEETEIDKLDDFLLMALQTGNIEYDEYEIRNALGKKIN